MSRKWGELVNFTTRARRSGSPWPGRYFEDHDFMITRNGSDSPARWLWGCNWDEKNYPAQFFLFPDKNPWGIPKDD